MSTAPVLILTNLIVFPLRKRRVSLSKNWRSVLTPPSLVNTLGSEPSTFITQISLFATNAILSAPPIERANGAVIVSVGAGRVSVEVSAGITTASVTAADVGSDVSLAGIDVKVLAGGAVAAGRL